MNELCLMNNLSYIVGFLSSNPGELALIKQRKKPSLIVVSNFKKLQNLTRVPQRYKQYIRRAKKTTFIYPNTKAIRVVHDSLHNELLEKLVAKGFLMINDKGRHQLTDEGKNIGGEFKFNSYGGYFLWLADMSI